MKRISLIIFAILVIVSGIIGVVLGSDSAVTTKSDVMDDYIMKIKQLQSADEATRTELMNQLKEDNQWTLLDEIGNSVKDEQEQYMYLGLNALAYEAAMSKLDDYGKPQGVFVDGRDPDYSICFIEKCLLAGSEVTYPLEHRTGKEEVAVVEMADDDLDVWMNGAKIAADNGVFRCVLDGDEISIRIRNRRGYAVNFVILNSH